MRQKYPPGDSISKATFERSNWWLRDVASSTNFANVNSNGNANANNSSNANGVRPDFGAPGKTFNVRQGVYAKGKAVFGENLNDSAIRQG